MQSCTADWAFGSTARGCRGLGLEAAARRRLSNASPTACRQIWPRLKTRCGFRRAMCQAHSDRGSAVEEPLLPVQQSPLKVLNPMQGTHCLVLAVVKIATYGRTQRARQLPSACLHIPRSLGHGLIALSNLAFVACYCEAWAHA